MREGPGGPFCVNRTYISDICSQTRFRTLLVICFEGLLRCQTSVPPVTVESKEMRNPWKEGSKSGYKVESVRHILRSMQL